MTSKTTSCRFDECALPFPLTPLILMCQYKTHTLVFIRTCSLDCTRICCKRHTHTHTHTLIHTHNMPRKHVFIQVVVAGQLRLLLLSAHTHTHYTLTPFFQPQLLTLGTPYHASTHLHGTTCHASTHLHVGVT